MKEVGEIRKPDVFPSCGYIREGERSDAALVVQMMLNALKVRYDGWDFISITNALDEATAAAVRFFREAHGMEDAPGVDAETWNALASEYSILRELE